MSARRSLLCYLAMVAIPAVLAWALPAYTLWWGIVCFSIYCVILAVQKRGLAQQNPTPL
jgi:membrane protein implicated in regulation of membrane protease activity